MDDQDVKVEKREVITKVIIGPVDLRDYFAAAALPGLLQYYGKYQDGFEAPVTFDARITKCAYSLADAMLKERSNS